MKDLEYYTIDELLELRDMFDSDFVFVRGKQAEELRAEVARLNAQLASAKRIILELENTITQQKQEATQ